MKASGLSVVFIGAAGAMEQMLAISQGDITSGQSMLVVASLTIGALIGEMLKIELRFEQFGEWLKHKTGNSGDHRFVDGFVTATLTVCIGAMAIVGAIQDGILGDYTILATKAVLDFVIIMVMASTLGKGAIFSALPVFLFEGVLTLGASFLKPFMTDVALANISLIGSILIFCVGINLIWERSFKVANFLPAIVVAVLASFIF